MALCAKGETKQSSFGDDELNLVHSVYKKEMVKIDSEKVSDTKLEIKKGSEAVYQVGKRKFLHIKIN